MANLEIIKKIIYSCGNSIKYQINMLVYYIEFIFNYLNAHDKNIIKIINRVIAKTQN